MLLRRVTQHIKAQNWFAVGIDFVIVILGVFIGIQVANWNEGRNLAVQERLVLQAIYQDLNADREIVKNSMTMAQVNLSASHYLFEQAGFDSFKKLELPIINVVALGGASFEAPPYLRVEESQKAEIWKHITIHYYPLQSDAALGALIAAGDLGIISEPELRRELQTYRAKWHSMNESNNLTFRPFRDRVVFVGQRFGLSPFIVIDEGVLVDLVKQNAELRGAIRTLAEFTLLHHEQMSRLIDHIEALMARIDRKLDNNH
jgi:hypothetical protein